MKREELLSGIFDRFDKSAKQFCEDSHGLYCEVSREYKGAERPENLKYCFAKIYYNSFMIKFTYTAHGTLGVVNSILGCSVCLDKNGDSPEIPLPLMTDYCEHDIMTPMFIPLITDEKGMEEAFIGLGDVLIPLLPEFTYIACDDERKNKVLNVYADELKYLFGVDDLEKTEGFDFYGFFTLRFTTDVFINYIKGNRIKAYNKLKKIKKLTGYEKRLMSYLLENKDEEINLTSLKANAERYNGLGVQKTEIKEFIALFISWIALTPLTSLVYLVVFFLFVIMENVDSVYLMGPIYYFPACFFFGFITAIAVSYFTRFKFYKLINKKDYEKYCEMDSIQNSGSSDKLMKGFTSLLFTAGLILTVLLAGWNINFKSDGFIDNTKFLSFEGKFYSYEEIEKVYYLPQRTNDFGDVLDFPSYVLVVDGKEIDFYDFADITDYETELLEYLSSKGVKIEKGMPQ